MKTLKHLLIGLALSVPIWSLFGVLLAWLILDYDRLYAIRLGPFLAIAVLVLGMGALILPFLNIRTVRKKGWRAAWHEHTYLPMSKFFIYVPLVVLSLWAWIWIALVPAVIISEGTLPEALLFMLALLMPVNEVFKGREKQYKLVDYQESVSKGTRELEPLHWSDRKLKIALYLESIAYLLLTWWSILAVIAVGQELLTPYLGFELRSFLYLICCIGIFLGTKWLEKRWHTYGRQQFWIPW